MRKWRKSDSSSPGTSLHFRPENGALTRIGNESGRPCRFLMLGLETPNEVAFYPNSRKVLIHRDLMLRSEPSLDYYDGE